MAGAGPSQQNDGHFTDNVEYYPVGPRVGRSTSMKKFLKVRIL